MEAQTVDSHDDAPSGQLSLDFDVDDCDEG
jgi:hypothetical protein